MGGTPRGTGAERDRGGAAGDEVLGTDHSPRSPFPCNTRQEEVEQGGQEVKGVLSLLLIFPYSSLLVIGNKVY